jgi:hypothetical protein
MQQKRNYASQLVRFIEGKPLRGRRAAGEELATDPFPLCKAIGTLPLETRLQQTNPSIARRLIKQKEEYKKHDQRYLEEKISVALNTLGELLRGADERLPGTSRQIALEHLRKSTRLNDLTGRRLS